MIFYLLDVLSTVIINGKEVAFDYINTYYTPKEAKAAAEALKQRTDIVRFTVHEWTLSEEGEQDHTGNILDSWYNPNHPENQ